MTHVVSESCIRCKYTDCVDVCPVDCFREGPNKLVIDPDECIDCAVCIPECPANAIFAEEDVPQDQVHFIELNAELTPVFGSIKAADGTDIKLSFQRTTCQDDMSGEAFEAKAMLTVGTRQYHGCGNFGAK